MINFFEKNADAIKKRFPHIYFELKRTKSDDSYIRMEEAKNGDYLVPILFNGKAMHSKYSHKKESEKMFNGNEETVLFCGIGAGYHIKYFLDNFPQKKALLTDFSYSSFRCLLELCDISDIVMAANVTLLPPVQEDSFVSYFVQSYLPMVMGNLSIVVLRVWRDCFYEGDTLNAPSRSVSSLPRISSATKATSSVSLLDKKIQFALNEIAQDISTQAKFGRIWMRNILLNMQQMSKLSPTLPKVDTRKTAYILGAGPSLEDKIDEIKSKRDEIAIFASDASFLPLLKNDISPDFFISIDPQIACASHCISSFPANIIAVFDLAASPPLVRQFVNNRNEVIFTLSHHPFAQYISSFTALPCLDIRGGTVAIAALNLARSLGFTQFESGGLDFAYTHGKAYTRGVYLHDLYQKDANRLTPEESAFTSLLFRGRVEKVYEGNGITYITALLDSYRKAFEKEIGKCGGNRGTKEKGNLWETRDFSSFLYQTFIETFQREAQKLYDSGSAIFLPFITWEKVSKRNSIDIKDGFVEAFCKFFC